MADTTDKPKSSALASVLGKKNTASTDSVDEAQTNDAPDTSSATNEKPYVHTPGTVHLNAYLQDVKDAEAKVSDANTELDAAIERLNQKKQESGMI